MKAITTAVCTSYLPSYKMSEERRVSFIRRRNKHLTARGCQRLINCGCTETGDEPREWTVIRVEHAALG